MYRRFFLIILFFLFTFKSFSLNYITTAESISWSGAYTSVADGFESMLYNPAGLNFTPTRYGFNVFGSYGLRIYTNTVSSETLFNMWRRYQLNKDVSKEFILGTMINAMPESGFEAGMDLSAANLMTYFKFEKFSLGFSILPKTSMYGYLSKGVFEIIYELPYIPGISSITTYGDLLNLAAMVLDSYNYSARAAFLQYIDFNVVLSGRAKALEKHIPVKGIYGGLTLHFYYPTFFMISNSKAEMGPTYSMSDGSLGPSVRYPSGYNFSLKGDFIFGGNGVAVAILKQMPSLSSYTDNILNYTGSAAFGLGFDAGFMIVFNKLVRLGVAATDVGFIVFPATARVNVDVDVDVNVFEDNFGDFPNAVKNELFGALEDAKGSRGDAYWYMPSTAFRCGVALTPLQKGMFTWATDISLSDFNRLLLQGYPTFNFSTGIEFVPCYKWFSAPLRLAFSYNSQANAPSFSAGIGFYFGPVELEFGFKGLEMLISGWGSREACAGVDLKFEF